MFERKTIVKPWEGKMTPFKIVGNVYFCGTFQASCHLIDTGDGLILIDPGYDDTLFVGKIFGILRKTIGFGN